MVPIHGIRRRTVHLLSLGSLLQATPLAALAQAGDDYPSRPVTIVHPYPAGGAVDVAGRLFADSLDQHFGKPFIVDPKPGGGHIIAMQAVKRAAPDGRTLLLHSNQITIAQSVHPKSGIDVRRDFEPVGIVARGGYALFVNESVPVRTFTELVDYTKAHPSRLNYGSDGIGGNPHLITERIKKLTGLQATHVPYPGGPPLMQALQRDDIQILVWPPANVPNRDRRKCLASLGAQRWDGAPEVPTLRECGVDMTSSFYLGLFAPARTPRSVIDRLDTALNAAVQSPEVAALYRNFAWRAISPSSRQARAEVDADVALWGDVVSSAGIRLE